MPLRDKIRQEAKQVALQVVNAIATRQNQVTTNQSAIGRVQSFSQDSLGNRLVTVTDPYGRSLTLTLTSNRVLGTGDSVVIVNGTLAQ